MRRAAILAAAALFGCATAPKVDATLRAASAAVKSNAETYEILYSTRPDPIPMNRLFTMNVTVVDGADGASLVPDVSLEVDARMPEHQHGMTTRPEVTPRGIGRFVVSGMQFHMAGRWELYFDVTRAGITERAQVTKIVE